MQTLKVEMKILAVSFWMYRKFPFGELAAVFAL